MKHLKTKLKSVKGFTLIELLVVIAIIGILGAIVYAPFQSARRKARDAQRIVEMKNLTSTIQLYADSHNGEYPTSTVALQASLNEKLPVATNASSSYDATEYNYTPFYDNTGGQDRVIGFHLYTHLETAAEAIAGAGQCYSQGSSQDDANPKGSFCIVSPNPDPISGGKPGAVVEPTNGSEAYFTDHSLDEDKTCATDLTKCILDYHQ